MEGVPDDVFQQDMSSFPAQDPRITEEIAKKHKEALKEQAARDAAAAKEQKKSEALAKKAMAMPVQKPASTKVEDTTRQRELKAHKIRLYFSKLGHKLSIREPKTIPRDEKQLDELLAAIECELQSSGGIDQASMLFVNSCFTLEAVTQHFNPLGLQLSGPAASLTQTVAANRDKWDELITEVAISNAEWFMMGPVKRCMLFIVQMVNTVDQTNKAAIIRGSTAPVSEEVKQETEDL